MARNPYKIHGSNVVYQNPWITIHEDEMTSPNGDPGIYAYMESKDSVMIAVLDNENRIYLAKSFRYPTKSWGWELPGGGGEGEDTIVASKRELVEETGITANSWDIIGKTYVCNGLMTEQMTVAVARELVVGENPTSDEEVFDGSGFFTLDEIDDLISKGEINDSQTLSGLYLLEKWTNKRKV